VSVRNLEALLRPRSIAVVGASDRAGSVGAVVMRNLLRGGFAGPVLPVHPDHAAVAGVLAYRDVAALPVAPDLAVLCTPAATVPGLVAELGARGTRAAVVVGAGFGPELRDAMLRAARPHVLRILGPNCLGLLVPGLGLDASFAHAPALAGPLAFLSQSGALCTAVLDWAASKRIGFSHFVSLGDGADVDVADLLDFLGSDPETHAILLYLESIRGARKFMSAARAAARNKPVLVIKAGRVAEGMRAAASHTGALAGSDAVYDAAFRRAGWLRVDGIAELFDAVETLARARPWLGERLAIVTNGGGPGVLATDALVTGGGRLAALAPSTLARLCEILPATWSRGNPVDLVGDASPERYRSALGALLEDPGVDALLVIHAPTALASGPAAAEAALAALAAATRRPAVLASWLGGEGAEPARRTLREGGVPSYDTPEEAVTAFLHRVRYRRNQELLIETPPSLPEEPGTDVAAARRPIERALAEGRELLSEPEAKAVLEAYGIPTVETRVAADAEQAVRFAHELGFPVALKVLSPDVTHKSDVGGVSLDLDDAAAVRAAARAMAERLAKLRPEPRLVGFSVQRMARRPGAFELLIGAAVDATFGPVVLFGHGGTAAERIADRAVALPPLNAVLARDLVGRTRIARLLAGFRERPPVDAAALHGALVAVGRIASELPEVVELDVNPLLADAEGVLALDARVRVAPARGAGADRLAIRPYPGELEEDLALADGSRVRARPIRPEDEPAHREFLQRLEPGDVRFRFFSQIREMPHSQLARYTQIDYDREMAFVATRLEAGRERTLGVVRAISDPDGTRAEFAIVVRSDLKGLGLGHALLEKLVRYCRTRGTRELVGQVLPDNRRMLELAGTLGFRSRWLREEGVVEVRLALAGDPAR
jgi:acetyltransferase